MLFTVSKRLTRQLRYFRLWPYLKAHPRLSFAGRTIAIDDPALDDAPNITGVRAANEPSQRVCHNCGLADSGIFSLGVSYPPLLEGGRFTR